VPYGALPEIGKQYGKPLAGKIVLDANNAVASRDGAVADEAEREGIGVTSQKYLAGTRLVRAFNTLGYMIFARERTVLPPGSRYRLPAMIRKRCKLRRAWCVTPASIQWRSVSSQMPGASSAARQGRVRM
jgi:hypothetical protein